MIRHCVVDVLANDGFEFMSKHWSSGVRERPAVVNILDLPLHLVTSES